MDKFDPILLNFLIKYFIMLKKREINVVLKNHFKNIIKKKLSLINKR
jgi:hypothetical protein